MKRTFQFWLVAVLSLAVITLSACGGDEENTSKKEGQGTPKQKSTKKLTGPTIKGFNVNMSFEEACENVSRLTGVPRNELFDDNVKGTFAENNQKFCGDGNFDIDTWSIPTVYVASETNSNEVYMITMSKKLFNAQSLNNVEFVGQANKAYNILLKPAGTIQAPSGFSGYTQELHYSYTKDNVIITYNREAQNDLRMEKSAQSFD